MNQGTPKPKIRIEKRCGKAVTVVAGLHTYGTRRLEAIAKELKSIFGTGGTVKSGAIEIQGERAVAIGAWLKDHPRAGLPDDN